jgi:hypothetical protein
MIVCGNRGTEIGSWASGGRRHPETSLNAQATVDEVDTHHTIMAMAQPIDG